MNKFTDKVKVYSIKEISTSIKAIIEHNFNEINIIGEVSNLKTVSAGHTYLYLKDDVNILFCTIWSFNKTKIQHNLQEGDKIIAKGKMTAYGGGSRYQLNIIEITPQGIGDLMKQFETLKIKLKDYFLQKRPIPKYPKKIGIVTSATGSVLQDIIHRITERYPVEIILSSTPVQGKTAAQNISNAIKKLQDTDIDTIIIARGGGSIEDLWCFNDEELVKTIFHSKIPTISAIGHETDFTLSDFAADLRAPTPTAAAELSTPDKDTLIEKILLLKNKFLNQYKFKIDLFNKNLKILEDDIKYNSPIINISQKLEITKEKFLNLSIENKIQETKSNFKYYTKTIFDYYKNYVHNILNNIQQIYNNEIYKINHWIDSPKSNILEFIKKNKISYVTNVENTPIDSVKNVPEKMYIHFIDGKVKVRKLDF